MALSEPKVHIVVMSTKRPRDPNQLAKAIVDIATGDATDSIKKLTPSQQFARKAGQKGGVARKKSLTPERRREIAKAAARARWAADGDDPSSS